MAIPWSGVVFDWMHGSGERDTPRLRDLDGRDNIRFVAKNNEEFEPHRVWTLQLKRVKQPDMGK